MSDMKGEIQEIAEDIAWEEYGCDFYNLSEKLQNEVYGRAMEEWNDRQCDRADRMLDWFRTEAQKL